MKKLSLLALAVAGLLLGACSDKDVDTGSETGILPGNGDGYIKVSLSIPGAVNVTRAWDESSQLDDGKDKEYAVSDAYLLLFEGDEESDAVLKQIVTLSPFSNIVGGKNDQVTVNSDEDFVAKIAKAPTSDLWALAVVNGASNSVISPSSTAGRIVNVNGEDIQGDVTLASLQDIITMTVGETETYANKLSFVNSESGYIFMTNAVLFDKQGGTVNPGEKFDGHTLVKVNQDYIYETQADAVNGEKAADIYVERGVAKVTIKGGGDSKKNLTVDVKEYGAPATGAPALTASIEEWALTNTNLKSHDVRVVHTDANFKWNWASLSTSAGTDKYRFVGNTAVDTPYGTALAGFRTYWADDPNYATGDLTYLYTAKATDYSNKVGDENPLYCFENTFDVAHQTIQNTTCAIVKVNIQVGGASENLYTIGENKKTFYTLDDVEKLAATRLFTIPAFVTFFNENHKEGVLELEADDVTLTLNTTAAGPVTVTSATINAAKLKEGANNVVSSAIISSLNNASVMGNIQQYVGGVAYYYVRIKHFGDDLTPWNLPEGATQEWQSGHAPAESTIATIYPTGTDGRQNTNYLGRYGVVRNNWYQLNLEKIVGMGSPTVPNLKTEEHPDDEIEDLYIKARINILSWAKRPQSWNLKK